jgi:hypothetical protein
MGEIEGQYGTREDPKKLAVIWEFPRNTGELVNLMHADMRVCTHTHGNVYLRYTSTLCLSFLFICEFIEHILMFANCEL